MKILRAVYLSTLLCAVLRIAEFADEGEQAYVWPKPISIKWGKPSESIPLSPKFRIISPPHKNLRNAVERYRRLIFSERWIPIQSSAYEILGSSPLAGGPPLENLIVQVRDLQADLQHGVDESYTLAVLSGGSANLTAQTPWGAMRGLETFSQLVRYSSGSPLVIQRPVMIVDRPLYPHRGVLLDTGRNFFPVRDILRTIRAMSFNKLNVFHWHITDSQSFPLELVSEPGLARAGAYSPAMQYSGEDVRRIVEYGRDQGVRVVPEIDIPGHSASWAGAYPDIVTCAGMFWSEPGTNWSNRLASEPGAGQLNPLEPKTYQVVKNVVDEVATLFPENFYHGGADEVVPGCWKTNPKIQKFVANGGSFDELLEKFVSTTHPYITALNNKTAVYWEDVLLDDTVKVKPQILPKETTILQTWNNGPNNKKRITAAGYRAIVSSADFFYLDCGHGGWVGNDSSYDKLIENPNGGSWCAPYKTWQRIYDYDIVYGLSKEEAQLVLGGEVAIWSEQADGTVLDGRLWPRASAMAESLWSGNRDSSGKKRYADAMGRLNEWRYRMVERGINAEPLQPLWCLRNPGMCNLNQ
ncbi:hypothetical protein SUGI_0018160 [Cryptomeria japonica]|uniref:beta-hexosaminidase 2 n=1 Tax=Cryptomeria japonica TaxID=3369 RepID=UPI002408E541|nr:beta-hexosaminidase 2 [Cryptomeria japonica]GLJ05433.1 hypothetical protein SUGI_0018160 [Cryptomeria japonica]